MDIAMSTAANWGYEISPWEKLLYDNNQVAAMLVPFAFMKATLKVRVTVAGHPYNMGKVIASYYPSSVAFLEHPVDGNFANSAAAMSQMLSRDHAWLDSSTSEGCVLTCPMILTSPFFQLGGAVTGYQKLGKLQFIMPSALANLNGSTEGVRLSIYAWLENLELRGATSKKSDSILAHQMAEEETHVVSDTATAVADAAGSLSNVPVIGTYARAVDVAARAGASVAKAFGFSRPTDHTPVKRVQQRLTENMINVNGPSDCTVISYDAKCEHTLDTSLCGYPTSDELSFESLGNRDHYVTTLAVTSADTTQTNRVIAVSPCLRTSIGDAEAFGPIGLLATMFSFWYSTIEYTFTFCSATANRGTYTLSWDPLYTGTTDLVDPGFVNTITFNLGETSVVKFTVPMMNKPLETVPRDPNAGIATENNGKLILQCIKPAMGISGTCPDITVVVTARFPDIRFGGMGDMPNYVLSQFAAPLAPQMAEEEMSVEVDKVADDPSHDEKLIATFFHGESIRSARALARSFAYVGTLPVTTTATDTSARIILTTPNLGGYDATGGFVRDTPSGDSYSHSCCTVPSLLWSSFVGRSGSTRYKVVLRRPDGVKTSLGPARVYTKEINNSDFSSAVVYQPSLTHTSNLHTLHPSESVISVQVPSNRNTLYQNYGEGLNAVRIEYDLEPSSTYYFDVYAADAEDTTYVGFRGIPLLESIARNPA